MTKRIGSETFLSKLSKGKWITQHEFWKFGSRTIAAEGD